MLPMRRDMLRPLPGRRPAKRTGHHRSNRILPAAHQAGRRRAGASPRGGARGSRTRDNGAAAAAARASRLSFLRGLGFLFLFLVPLVFVEDPLLGQLDALAELLILAGLVEGLLLVDEPLPPEVEERVVHQ